MGGRRLGRSEPSAIARRAVRVLFSPTRFIPSPVAKTMNVPLRAAALLAVFLCVASRVCAQAAAAAPLPVEIRVDAAAIKGELKPIYRFFGADEPNYAYMKD